MSENNVTKVPNLMKILEERGMANKISKATGISSGNISDWKKGKSAPNREALTKIANYLNCSVDYLLGNTDNPNGNELNSDLQDAEAVRLFANLSGDDRKFIINVMNFLPELSNENKEIILKLINSMIK